MSSSDFEEGEQVVFIPEDRLAIIDKIWASQIRIRFIDDDTTKWVHHSQIQKL